MTFVELLKKPSMSAMLQLGNKYIYWQPESNEWVVIRKRKNASKTIELFRSCNEADVVAVLMASK